MIILFHFVIILKKTLNNHIMKNLNVFALCGSGIWHIYFFFSSNSYMAGIFKIEPNIGYLWAKSQIIIYYNLKFTYL